LAPPDVIFIIFNKNIYYQVIYLCLESS
jgi:hypothetical protein